MTSGMEKRAARNKKIVWGWIGTMVISTVLVFLLEKNLPWAQGLTLVMSVVFGWSFVFVVIKVGLEHRHFKALAAQVDNVVLGYQKNQKGQKAVEGLKTLAQEGQTNEEFNYINYYTAHLMWETGDETQAHQYLAKVEGFPKDPLLQEDFLKLKKEMAQPKQP